MEKNTQQQEEEKWMPVVGYKGLYEVSNLGRVKSLRKKIIMAKRPLGKRGEYLAICFCKDKKNKYYLVHRIVAMAFIKNPNKKPCVNHLNSVGHDNRACNLEWATYKENTAHGIKKGTINISRKGSEFKRLDDIQKSAIITLYNSNIFSQIQISNLLCIPESTINTFIKKIKI